MLTQGRAAEIKRKEKWETVYTDEMVRKVARGTDDRARVEGGSCGTAVNGSHAAGRDLNSAKAELK